MGRGIKKAGKLKSADFKKLFKRKGLVRLKLSDGDTPTGFVIGLSELFVVTADVKEWHIDGVKVYPLKHVLEIDTGKRTKSIEEILQWHNVIPDENYGWLNIKSYYELFSVLQSKQKTVWIGYKGKAQVGIIKYFDQSVVHSEDFNADGNWMEGVSITPYDDITDVGFDSEYILKLRAFADRDKVKDRKE